MTVQLCRPAEFVLGRGLDLTDAFARETEPVADLLQRQRLAAVETEPEPHHESFAIVEVEQSARELGQVALANQVFIDGLTRKRNNVREAARARSVAAGQRIAERHVARASSELRQQLGR